MTIQIRNWKKWQSYRKDRGQPPWIKLHRALMRDPHWVALSDAQRGQLISMWMLAADRDGEIPDDPVVIKKLCYMEFEPDLEVFDDQGFITGWRHIDAKATPRRRQVDAKLTHQSRIEKSRIEKSREEKTTTKTTGTQNVPEPVESNSVVQVSEPKTPQAEFVERFKVSYEAMTGQPFNFKKEQFVIVARLIKDHGMEAVVQKAKILGVLCKNKSAWFAKGGWADFTIEKLSSQWNSILPEAHQESPQDKEAREKAEIEKKVRDTHERLNQAMGRR